MKNLLSRRIMSDRSSAAWVCLFVCLPAFLVSVVGLATVDSKRPLVWAMLGFSIVGFATAIAIWRQHKTALLVCSALFVITGVFSISVGWKGYQDLAQGIFPFLSAAWTYSLYRADQNELG